MPKGNCKFEGTGGQYFFTILIHIFLLSIITFGLYSAWAWVRVFRLKASHTTINDKSVTFTGTGGELFVLMLIQGILTIVTLGFYAPWAICKFFTWKAQNTQVDSKSSQFTGTGGSLFVFYLIHLMLLPILTLGIYYFLGLYRLYAWKEEHTRYGDEKTSFGAGFGGFLKVGLISWLLNSMTMGLFTSWAMCMLYRWQIEGLAVGDGEEVEHFQPVETNRNVVIGLIIIVWLPLLALGFYIKGQYQKFSKLNSMRAQMSKPDMKIPSQEQALKMPTRESPPPKATPPVPKIPTRLSPEKEPSQKDAVNYESELKKINGFIKLNDKNADAFYNRGWLYLAKGDLQMAKRDYSTAILLDKNHFEAYYNRGLVFAKMNEYTQAIRDFDEAITLNPADVDAYCNRGSSYFQLNKMDPALGDYNKGLEIDPYDADLYYNRALVFLEKGQKPEAMKDFQEAAQLGHSRAQQYLKTPPSRSAKLETVSTHEVPGKTPSPGQRMDLKDLHIPESIASGKIHGEDFTVENAKINAGILTLRQGEGFFADREVIIFLFLREGEKPDGRTFHVSKESNVSVPHIHMKWKEKNGDVPETEMFIKDYVMRLELGTREEGKLPGRIYLALPDTLKSFLAGKFDVEIK
ncbi:MAG: DUF898 family protein [Desulfatiglandales bacterium]